ncbi:diacylglycerol kinase [Mycolicibacterium parafortuitum]|uniref:Diacylglycerol kinase n=1 Tax=Mycolicibacterium parafortuitum TaxID=39692 RepID=A0A7I7U7Y2_MYCPF|nr:dihydrodipicolinate reductase [Mycolicibacterium parafortuitum]PQD97753.1 dihydrodipicolinate reductase [Mycobacterium sp. EPG1]BBY77013.1 diacylglycerol kinase [Mycolicibacterium parafortuitum]
MSLRVIQVSTGNVGVHALRQIIESPHLDLVGLHANNPAKIGRDAGELCGLGDTGVVATDDIAELVALNADCVVYTSQAETRPQHALAELVAFLEAGTNVVATSMVWFIHPPHADAWLREPLEAACAAGGASLYINGIDPGFSGDTLPLAALTLCQSVERVCVQEIFDYATYDDAEFTGISFGFGFAADDDPPMILLPGVLTSIWGGPVKLVADALGVELDEIRESHDTWLATEAIDCAMMRVEPGHVAAVRFSVEGIKDGRSIIAMEHVNRLTAAAAPDWPYPPDGRPGVHRVIVTGRPGVEMNTHVGLGGIDLNEGGVIATAARVVNAIPAVVAARPGVLELRDLPVAQAQGLLR